MIVESSMDNLAEGGNVCGGSEERIRPGIETD